MRGAALALIVALCGPAAAAQPATFAEAMDEALAGGGTAVPWLRCAGLFRAFHLLAGPETELGAEAREAEIDLAVVSAVLREDETGAEPGAAMAQVAPLIGAAAELYLDRMAHNEEAAANVMDDGLRASLAACSTLRAEAQAGPAGDAP
jgi:hypothetical protein